MIGRRIGGQLLGPALGHDLAAVGPRAGAKVDDPVGGPDHGLVVLDDDHAAPLALKPAQAGDELIGVAGMQAGGRLIEHVADADQPRAKLRGQPGALQLAAGERVGAARRVR